MSQSDSLITLRYDACREDRDIGGGSMTTESDDAEAKEPEVGAAESQPKTDEDEDDWITHEAVRGGRWPGREDRIDRTRENHDK